VHRYRLALLLVALVLAAPASADARIALGLADQPGGAAAMRGVAPFGFRYQYLAGGVNTGHGWQGWNEHGTFVTRYIAESVSARITPVFTYYMIRQSLPGADVGDEPKAVLRNLRDRGTMKTYWADLATFFRRAGSTHRRTILHVEPDMWGYLEQAHATRLARAFAHHVLRLRKRYAPNVRLGYHMSTWGTGTDLAMQDPSGAAVDRLAAQAAGFYKSLRARFDFVFGEFSDRDSGFRQHILGLSRADAWWTPGDFARHVRFLRGFHRRVKRPILLWQIPLGNTGLPDKWNRFRDNRPQWLLGKGSARHRAAYASAGVKALLFGGGADGTTSAKTDGGWFLRHARVYYR
jgi:hypothetical protein